MLVVVRQGADRAHLRQASGSASRPRRASASGQARVRRLRPAERRVEGEVDAGGADAGGERAVVSAPALQASMSMLSLEPAARTVGMPGSIGEAGSFCLLVENGPLGLPVLTSVSLGSGSTASSGGQSLGAGGGEDQAGEDGNGAEPKDGLHSASMRVSGRAARFATVHRARGGDSR